MHVEMECALTSLPRVLAHEKSAALQQLAGTKDPKTAKEHEERWAKHGIV